MQTSTKSSMSISMQTSTKSSNLDLCEHPCKLSCRLYANFKSEHDHTCSLTKCELSCKLSVNFNVNFLCKPSCIIGTIYYKFSCTKCTTMNVNFYANCCNNYGSIKFFKLITIAGQTCNILHQVTFHRLFNSSNIL